MSEVLVRAAAAEPAAARVKDDELIEWQFVKDYGEFALQMNFLGCAALLEKVRDVENPVRRKSILFECPSISL